MFRIITGITVFVFGLWLAYQGFNSDIGLIIPGVLFALVGLVIVFNKHEDDIEEIKNNGKK